MNVIEILARRLSPVLEQPLVRRIRRNHGLEHATIHLLNRKRYVLSGRASVGGFIVIGDVPTETVETAAHEALRRMRGGQASLAVHPNCGTNLVTTGLLLTTIAALGFTGTNRRGAWERFPLVLLMMMGAVVFSQPLGMQIQQYMTTSGEPGDTEIVAVRCQQMQIPFRGPLTIHQVITRNG